MFSVILDEAESGSLTSRVFHKIEKDILDGTYAPGAGLTEAKLCETLGVSRTPVREALFQLEQEGLIRIAHNRGAVVIGISEKDIADIYLIRIRIEDLAVRWAAESMTDEERKDLLRLVELQEFYLQKEDWEQLCELDGAFHEALYRYSRSNPLKNMLSGFHHYISHARTVSVMSYGRGQASIREHRLIAEALLAHDGEQAAERMVEHITKARDNLLQMLPKDGETDE